MATTRRLLVRPPLAATLEAGVAAIKHEQALPLEKTDLSVGL